jgi:hypothetical protein
MTAKALTQITARLPGPLVASLEDERHARSRRLGRRVSLRELIQIAIQQLLDQAEARHE